MVLFYSSFSLDGLSYIFHCCILAGRYQLCPGTNYLNPEVNDYQKAAYYFGIADSLRHEHVYDDKLSSSYAYLAAVAAYQKENDVAKKLIEAAKVYNDISLKASPLNVLYWKTKAKNQYLFYQVSLNSQDLNEGIKALLTAEKLSPTDPKIPYSLTVFYSLAYNQVKDIQLKETSLMEINKAIQLKGNYQDAISLKKELLKQYSNR